MSTPRRVVCERCGAEFSCDLSGQCWCANEPARLPVPVAETAAAMQDCLCPHCLHRAASLKPDREKWKPDCRIRSGDKPFGIMPFPRRPA